MKFGEWLTYSGTAYVRLIYSVGLKTNDFSVERITSKSRNTEIVIEQERLPTDRYKRNVVRTRLDLLGKRIHFSRKLRKIMMVQFKCRKASNSLLH